MRLLWALRDNKQTLKDLYNVKKCADDSQVCTEKECGMVSLIQTCNDTAVQYLRLLLTQEISSDLYSQCETAQELII